MTSRSQGNAHWAARLLPKGLRPWLLATAVMCVAVVLVFSHVILTDWSKISGMFDVPRYFGPHAFFMDYTFHNGELPLWNPLCFCGTPFAANVAVMLFYPLNFLRSNLTFDPTPLKTHIGMALLMGLHMVIAGVGMFLYARDHKLSTGAGLVAAFGFALSASFVRRACAFQMLFTVAWLPFMFLLLRRALSAPTMTKKVRYGVGAGLVSGVSILGGAPQTFMYMSAALGTFCVVYRLLHIKPAGEQARRARLKLLGSDFGVVVVMAVIALLIACAMLIPTTEFALASGRMKGGAPTQLRMAQRGSLKFLYQCLIMYPGPASIRQNMRGTGAGIVLLALAGLTHRRWRDALTYAMVCLVLCDLSLGPPLPVSSLILWLSPYQLVESSRAYMVACFPLAMLAGLGVDAVSTRLKWSGVGALRSCVLTAAGLGILIPLSRWVDPHPYLAVSKAVVYVPAATLAVAVLSGWLPPAKVWRTVLAVLVLAEIATWNQRFVPHLVSGGGRTKLTAHRDRPRPWQDNYRGADPRPQEWLYALRPAMNGYSPLYIGRVRQLLCSPSKERQYWRKLDREEVTEYNHRGHLFLKRAFWLARQYVDGPLPGKDELFPAATTVFLENPGDLPVPRVTRHSLPASGVSRLAVKRLLFQGKPLPVVVKDGPRGRASQSVRLGTVREPPQHSVVRLQYVSNCAAQVTPRFRNPKTGQGGFGKRSSIRPTRGSIRTIELPVPDFRPIHIQLSVKVRSLTGRIEFKEISLVSDQADEDDRMTILKRTANTVTVEVADLPDYRVLTFLDADYPGWEAYVDSERVEILTANDAFKAVVVPPGTHRVRFVFRPRSVFAGMAVSSLTLILAAGILVWTWQRER